MSGKIRLPNITGTTSTEQLVQIRSFLFQLVDELNHTLTNAEAGGTVVYTGSTAAGGTAEKQEAGTVAFNSLKPLIIKSADIVNAYYEVISKRLSGLYVAKSDFGTYTEETSQAITENSTGIDLLFSNIQSIITDIENVENTLIEVNAHIHPGLLYYDDDGVPVYGLEIGQRTEIDGVEVFNKYAQFTSEKLSFYDQNGSEVAYISDKKLYITHIQVTGSYRIGGLVDTALANGSVVTRYVAEGGDE